MTSCTSERLERVSSAVGEVDPSPMARFAESRDRILARIGRSESVTFIRGYGNIGDDLIYAGARQLLANLHYDEVGLTEISDQSGDLAVLAGSGAFCRTYPQMVKYLPVIEERFQKLVILPSSFDASVPEVRAALEKTKAFVYARELHSYDQIRDLCPSELAHDCAFYFNYAPYARPGRGRLNAFRTDKEASGRSVPRENNDLSASCESLDQFLWTIARHEWIRTDRAHVMIAGAMLGKRVEYRASNYHKVPAIAEFSLSGFSISRLSGDAADEPVSDSAIPVFKDGLQGAAQETRGHDIATARHQLVTAAQEVADLWSPGENFLLVDDGQVLNWPIVHRNAIPFLEKDGKYWGPPADDESAIRELQRLREAGAAFIAFSWHAFWWLEHYKGFFQHLKSQYQCLLRNERLVIFNLRTDGA